MLVISSNTYPVFVEHRKVWKRYMHSNPNVDCYFIQFNPSLRFQSHTFDGDTLTFPGVERYESIYLKTILALRYFLVRGSYDYVVRANLSGVWDLSKLMAYLETCPRTRFYAGGSVGHGVGFQFASGSGIIWSSDVAHSIAANPNPSWKWTTLYDDVTFGQDLHTHGIVPVSYDRVDFRNLRHYELEKHTIPPNVFQFRFKHIDSINSRLEEPITMNRLLDERIFSKPIEITQGSAEDPRQQDETKDEKEQTD